MIGNMETSGAARVEAFVDYLLFFQKRGYNGIGNAPTLNLNWILTPDNYNISKKSLSESTRAVNMRTVSIRSDT